MAILAENLHKEEIVFIYFIVGWSETTTIKLSQKSSRKNRITCWQKKKAANMCRSRLLHLVWSIKDNKNVEVWVDSAKMILRLLNL